MLLNKLSVQNKILATLTVPFIVIFAAAAVFTWVSIDNWRDANQVREVTPFISEAKGLALAIGEERAIAVEMGRDNEEYLDEFNAAIAKREAAFQALDSGLSAQSFDRMSEQTQIALDELRTLLPARMENASVAAQRGTQSPAVLVETYDASISLIYRFVDTLGTTLDDRRTGTAVVTKAALNTYLDAMTAEGPVIRDILDTSKEGTAQESRKRDAALMVRETDAMRVEVIEELNRSRVSGAESIPALSPQYSAVRQLVAYNNPEAVSTALDEQWEAVYGGELQKLDPAIDVLHNEMEFASETSENNAGVQALLTTLGVLMVLGLSLGVAYVTSRSITRPLRELADATDKIKSELPRLVEQMATPGQQPDIEIAPIVIASKDEVGHLADSFNAVNATTIEVAREQAALRGSIAEMFVNVARRDHILLNRQLGFLDELERQEEDPNTLSNLFRLDHLATRMRRNSESLLVLAGIDSGRRIREAMAMSDVVRTASSEIEQYDRVQLNLQDDPHILGHNALNSAHLIAELLENATNFSEPHTPVEVTTAATKQAVTVTIRDFGLGMTDADIADANIKVASKSATDVVGVQRVGLFVVGRLADRLGITVTFERPADGSAGTVVRLSFPLHLFADQSGSRLPLPTDPLGQETQSATNQWLQATPEVVKEVDLHSLTDGQTPIGMPKRRISAAAVANEFVPRQTANQPTNAGLPTRESAPSVTEFDEASIVLPPISTPLAPVTSDRREDWHPETPALPTGGLPTRRTGSNAATAIQEDVVAAPQTPERRSSMFSSFRPINVGEPNIQNTGQTPAIQAPAGFGQVANEAPSMFVPALVEPTPEPQVPTYAGTFEPNAQVPENTFGYAPSIEAELEVPNLQLDAAQQIEVAQQFEVGPVNGMPPSFAPVSEYLPPSFAPDGSDLNASSYGPSDDGGEWAERFADLPTRASRRIAALSALSARSPESAQEPGLAPKSEEFTNAPAPKVEEEWTPNFSADFGTVPLGQTPTAEPQVPAGEHDFVSAGQPLVTVDSATLQESHDTPMVVEHYPSVGEFADIVSDAPAGNTKPRKQGLIARVFGKKAKPSDDHIAAAALISAEAPLREQQVPAASNLGTFNPEGPREPQAFVQPSAQTAPSAPSFDPHYALGQEQAVEFQPTMQVEQPFQPSFQPHIEQDFQFEAGQELAAFGASEALNTGAGAERTIAAVTQSSESPFATQQPTRWSAEWQGTNGMGEEPAFALRSTIQEQAFAELSELSAYRPNAVAGGGNLTRRVRANIESTHDDDAAQKISRDAAQLRARLTAFQSATQRGREDGGNTTVAQGAPASVQPARVPDSVEQ